MINFSNLGERGILKTYRGNDSSAFLEKGLLSSLDLLNNAILTIFI
jgi:hypothetical protein